MAFKVGLLEQVTQKFKFSDLSQAEVERALTLPGDVKTALRKSELEEAASPPVYDGARYVDPSTQQPLIMLELQQSTGFSGGMPTSQIALVNPSSGDVWEMRAYGMAAPTQFFGPVEVEPFGRASYSPGAVEELKTIAQAADPEDIVGPTDSFT